MRNDRKEGGKKNEQVSVKITQSTTGHIEKKEVSYENIARREKKRDKKNTNSFAIDVVRGGG